ncbi:MAG: LysE family translocator [Deltaproteobacteria bacterium]|nr:LysE family translocator [Deltaproteobacteria bacterium]TLN03358.1 MAG: LysE family translocator [bacterium]
MTATTVLYFLGASLALTIAPGPDNTFIVAQGISRGRKAALVTALGMCSGISVHTTAAALGISALLYSSATAFQILKFAGAAYLLFLAWKSLKEQRILLPQGVGNGLGFRALFRRGFLMNVINPKVALFFLAFLPQFVSPGSENASLQMFLFGLLFMMQAVVVFSVIGWLSGGVGNLILKRPHLARWFGWLTAGVFASLGIRLALAER